MGAWKKTMDRETGHTGGPFRRESDDNDYRVEVEVEASPTLLTFGKYRGKEISEVYESDIQYAKWLYPQEILIGEYPMIKKYLSDKFAGADLSYVMTWGKFKGKTIKWINDNDKTGYIGWLRKNEFVNDKCAKLKKALSELE